MRCRTMTLLFSLVVSVYLCGFAVAQDTPAADDETPQVAADDETPQVAAEPSAAAEFARQFADWKVLLEQMRSIRNEYQDTDADQLGAIRQRYAKLVVQADVMLVGLRDAVEKAYVESPNDDREVTRFLIQLLGDDVFRDNYESAARLSKILMDHGCDEKEILSFSGMAAFATNDFANAETYLKQAKQDGTLAEPAQKFLAPLADYKKYWKVERALREADNSDLPQVKMTTSRGEMVIELFENEAPQTVGNFVSLVEDGFYNGLTFHRVLPAFMAQAGCPEGTGSGGPGYKIYCECHEKNHRKHFRGSLSMAHAGKNTGGSQFFLTFVPTPHLNGRHTVFGRVIEGFDVLSKLQRIDPNAQGSKARPDTIVSVEVLQKRDHRYAPTKVE